MKRIYSSVFLILCMLIIVTIATPAMVIKAQGQGWTSPVQISGTTQSSWFPDIVISPDNHIHITWSSGVSRGEEAADQIDLLLYSVLKDGLWSKPNDIVNPGTGGFVSRHSIVMGRDGRLHLLVRSQLRIDYMQAPWDQATSAHEWGEPRKISNQSTTYYDALAIDSTNTLHAFWNESIPNDPLKPNKECPACSELFYRSSQDEGKRWSEPTNLSQSPEGSAKPQVKIDKDDNMHLVWDEGKDTIVGKGTPLAGVYRRSRDSGVSWDPPTRFTLPSIPAEDSSALHQVDAPQQMTVGLFQNDAPIVVYRATLTNQVYFQFSVDQGQTWSAATPVPGVLARDLNDTPWDSYSMVTDGAGKVHLVMSGFPSSDLLSSSNLLKSDQRNRPRLLHLVWDGLSWSAPEVIATEDRYPGWSPEAIKACDAIEPNSIQARTEAAKTALRACQQLERYPEWPRVAIGGNTLHLTWFTRDGFDLHDSEHAHYQIWYSSKQLDAPAVESLPQFTPVPSAAPSVPTAAPALVPTPTLAPAITNAPFVNGPPAWETSGLTMLGIAVLPVFGLVILIIIMRAALMRRQRRVKK
jgi:hypothetical protein